MLTVKYESYKSVKFIIAKHRFVLRETKCPLTVEMTLEGAEEWWAIIGSPPVTWSITWVSDLACDQWTSYSIRTCQLVAYSITLRQDHVRIVTTGPTLWNLVYDYGPSVTRCLDNKMTWSAELTAYIMTGLMPFSWNNLVKKCIRWVYNLDLGVWCGIDASSCSSRILEHSILQQHPAAQPVYLGDLMVNRQILSRSGQSPLKPIHTP